MYPQEIQKQNLEGNKTNENINENNKSKDKFQKIIEKSNLKKETIENIKKILALVDINELNDFIISEPDLDDVINQWKEVDLSLSLEWIIDNFLMKFWESKNSISSQEIIKENLVKKIDEWNLEKQDIKSEKSKINSENEKERNNTEALKTLDNRKNDFKKIFWENSKFFQLFENHKDEDLAKELTNFLSNKDNAKEFFQTLNDKNPALYKETYNAVIAISPELRNNFTAWWIPSEPYKPEPVKPTDPIVPQFPWAKPEDIERRWNLVSYWDKTIDLKTGKAFISGEWWYAIETSMKVPNSLDVRAKYLAERLEIIDEIKTNEKIISEVDEYQETLKYEKYLNAQYEKLALNHDIDSNLAKAEIESKLITIKKYKELVEERYPKIKENPEEIKNKANNEIKKLKEKLTALKTKFDEDMQKLLEAWQDEILARDKKVRETMSFLDDLWITNINQNDLQKIIDRINIHPHAYGFSKPIDLKAWFEWSPTDALKQKKEFFHLFSKIYEKMNFDPPVKSSIIDGFTKDERLKDDTKFKQKLEDIWVTRGWAIQIETVMNILWEKPEEREIVYNGKPTQAEIINETVETK